MYGINAESGLKTVGGNVSFYIRMLGKYEQGNHLQALLTALEGSDMAAIVSAAHTLKGVSANLGLDEVFELAKYVELTAKDNTLQRNDPKIDELKQAYALTIESILKIAADPALLS